MSTLTGQAVGGTSRWVDDRFRSSNFVRRSFNKVFPDHWSFMIGEIALFSFIILLITGTYLTFFYNPSLSTVVYDGPYAPLRGQEITEAYASSLHISFDVKGGLLIRQVHHWAALLFVASIVVHLLRVFFTGAFRKPREVNWVIGSLLLILAIVEGFVGYSLPDDLLSGTGLRIAWSIILSVPVVGSWAAFLIFGGEYPGEIILTRFYVAHILLIPGILLALITAHMMILWVQKHTQFRGPGRTEKNVVGSRMYPTYAAKAGGFLAIVFGVLVLLGGLVQINPIWLYGPYHPSDITAGSQPDWYMGFLDGSVRLMPAWEISAFGYTIPMMLLLPGAGLAGLMFTLLLVYPFIEQWFSKDRDYHNLLDRPRDAPVRTGVGAMALTFYMVLLVSGANDVIAAMFDISLNAMTWAGRIGLIVLPPLAYWVTYRICLGLQKADEEKVHHGIETGIIKRLPSGEFVEVHAPLPDAGGLILTQVESDHASQGATSLDDPASEGRQRGVLATTGQRVRGFFVKETPQDQRSDDDSDAGASSGQRRELSGQQ